MKVRWFCSSGSPLGVTLPPEGTFGNVWMKPNKTEVRLPATTKAKLVRLVQKERGFIQVPHSLGERWTSISKTTSSSSFSSYRGREGRAFSTQLSCQPLVHLGP